jgi:hypothetical protein
MPMTLTCTDRNGRVLASVYLAGSYSATEHRRARIYKIWHSRFKDPNGAKPYIFVSSGNVTSKHGIDNGLERED